MNTHCAINVEMELEQGFTSHSTKIGYFDFGDVLSSQSLGSALKKAKLNKTNLEATEPKWSKLDLTHRQTQQN